MTNKRFTQFAGAALVGAAMTMAANAATTSYSSDDLFIGFTKAGSSQDYLVDIGQASNYSASTLGGNVTITLSVGDTNSDLVAAFGGTSGVSWGVVGTTHLDTVGTDSAHTIYASKAGNAWDSTPWNTASSTILGSSDIRILGAANAYNGKTSTINSSVGLIQTNVGTASNAAFASYQPGGANAIGGAANMSFAYFNPTILNNVSGTLALYQLKPGSGASTAVGTFAFNSSTGAITYTSVPEPTSAALGLIGTVLMVLRRRRR